MSSWLLFGLCNWLVFGLPQLCSLVSLSWVDSSCVRYGNHLGSLWGTPLHNPGGVKNISQNELAEPEVESDCLFVQ